MLFPVSFTFTYITGSLFYHQLSEISVLLGLSYWWNGEDELPPRSRYV